MPALRELWLRDQQLAFVANLLHNASPVDSDFEAAREAIPLLRLLNDWDPEPEELTSNTIHLLATLPPQVTDLLEVGEHPNAASLHVAALARQQDDAARPDTSLTTHALALLMQPHTRIDDFLKWAARASPRASAGSKSLGDRRTSSARTPSRWVSSGWKSVRSRAALLDDADEALQTSRTAGDIHVKVASIDRLHAGIAAHFAQFDHPCLQAWSRVCQALMSRQFAWPLLALGAEGFSRVGTSLPLHLTLQRQQAGEREVWMRCWTGDHRRMYYRPPAGDRRVHGFEGGSLNWRQDFHRAFDHALFVARDLWLSQNGRAEAAVKEATLQQQLLVDWTFANQIAKGVIVEGTSPPELDGRSAEAYFCQVILSQLLDSQARPVGAATGKVLMRQQRHAIDWVEDIEDKAKYVQRSGTFTRLALPYVARARTDVQAALRSQVVSGRLEVTYNSTARSMADAMQRGGWRRATFLNASEDRYFFFRTLGRLHAMDKRDGDFEPDEELFGPARPPEPMEDWELNRLRKIVNGYLGYGGAREHAVRWVTLHPTSCTPYMLGQTLALLDHQTRVGTERAGPALGIVCVRASTHDNEMQLWSRIFEALDVAPGLTEEFRWATSQQARAIVASVLNNFEGDQSISFSPPPDLLVIVDEGGFTFNADDPRAPDHVREKIFPEDFRCNLKELLIDGGLQDKLEQLDSARQFVLGRTRIVVLRSTPNHPPSDFTLPPPKFSIDWHTYTTEQMQQAARLRVFRGGFPIQCASAVINHGAEPAARLSAPEVVELLAHLKADGLLGYHRGDYYFRTGAQAVIASADLEFEPYLVAGLHLAAARAWAPIISPSLEFSAVNRDSLVDAGAIDQALWHLARAREFTTPRHQDRQGEIREAQLCLLSLAPQPDWNFVRPLLSTGTGGIAEALELAEELLVNEAHVRGDEALVHSSRYALGIHVLSRAIQGEASVDKRAEYTRQAEEWHALGMSSITHLGGPQAVKLLSEYADFLMRADLAEGPAAAAYDAIQRALDAALDSFWQGRRGWLDVPVSQSYFERRMARPGIPPRELCRDARIALDLWGARWHKPWTWLWEHMSIENGFDNNEIAKVLLDRLTPASASELGHKVRMSTIHPVERERVNRGLVNLVQWTLHGSNPLRGRPVGIVAAIVDAWVWESHNCYQLAEALPIQQLLDVLRGRTSTPPEIHSLVVKLLEDKLGAWSVIGRLTELTLSPDECIRLVEQLAGIVRGQRIEFEPFTRESRDAHVILGKFAKRRKSSMDWLANCYQLSGRVSPLMRSDVVGLQRSVGA